MHWDTGRQIILRLKIVYSFRQLWVHRSGKVGKIPLLTGREAERHYIQLIIMNTNNRYDNNPLILLTVLNMHMDNHFSQREVKFPLKFISRGFRNSGLACMIWGSSVQVSKTVFWHTNIILMVTWINWKINLLPH